MAKNAIENLGREAIETKGWFQAHKWLLLRRLSQIMIISLFMIGPVAGFSILKGNLSSSLVLETIPLTDPFIFIQMMAAGFWGIAQTAIIGAVIVAAVYFIIGGRVYCSWVCPVNIVTDTAHWVRRKLGIKTKMHLTKNLRLWVLFMVMALALLTGTLAYESVNAVSLLHRGLIFGMTFGWVLIAAIFLFDLFIMRHGWCGYVCPMGAFYGLIGQASLVRVQASKRGQCDDCMECFEVCPEPQVISPALRGEKKKISSVITSGACTNCGRCIDICAEDVFRFGLRGEPKQVTKPASQIEI